VSEQDMIRALPTHGDSTVSDELRVPGQGASSGRSGPRLVPILGWLRSYNRRWLRGDLIAGMTVAALIVPKNLGYAEIAGIPVQNGLYAAAAGAILYAIFGTCRQISMGPSSGLAAVAASAVFAAGITDRQEVASFVAGITLASGAVFLLLAVFPGRKTTRHQMVDRNAGRSRRIGRPDARQELPGRPACPVDVPARDGASPGRGCALHLGCGLLDAKSNEPYHDLGADWHSRRHDEAHTRRLVAQLERLGHTVIINPAA
jgi:hypothetical protein